METPFATLSDEQSQEIVGGGWLTSYYYEQQITFTKQSVTETFYLNNGGQKLSTEPKNGNYQTISETYDKWVMTSDETIYKGEKVTQVKGKGGVDSVYSTLYIYVDGAGVVYSDVLL